MTRPALPAALCLALLLLLQEAQLASADDDPEGAAEVAEAVEQSKPKSVFESLSDVGSEMSEVTRDIGRRIWEWLFGKASEGEHSDSGDGEAEGGPGAAEPGPLLSSFCGFEIAEEKAVDCGCCADHLIGSQVAALALLYGSHASDEAPAFFRNGPEDAGRSGRVRVRSLGDSIPSVWCDRGQPICRCEDPLQAWHVSEPACRAGAACVPPVEPEELSSTPLKDDAPAPPPGTAGCTGETPTRIPIGSARCEDMSVRQCSQLYSRGESGWHYCEVDAEAVRTCGAKLSDEVQLKRDADEHMHWAAQLAYTPDLKWTVAEREDHTFRVAGESMPPADEVRALLKKFGQPPPPVQSS